MEAGVTIWHWTVRHFIPDQQEEFSIDLDTEGRLVGFRHIIPETTERPPLTEDAARAVAEDFLKTQISKHPFKKLELLETGADEKPGYLSHSFTWKRTDWQWGTGVYHLHIRVDGDQVGRYSEHLKSPESWSREFSQKRSENRIYGYAARVLSGLLGLGVIILFIRFMLKNKNLWQRFPGRWLAPLALVLLLTYGSRFPELLSIYNPRDNFTVFITNNFMQLAFSTLALLFNFLIIGFIADIFWQKEFPGHVSIRAFLSGRGLATREALHAIPISFVLALAMLAYITAYYLLGREIGIWAPSSIDYAKVLTSKLPAIEALSVGLTASWQEELFYRVLALILVHRMTGSKWLAIIIPAVAWGFMHSDYPQMPGYARGVELSLVGIFFGWIVIRYGILTTLLAHCLFNTWLGAIIAWRTGTPLHMAMAILVSIWPAALWIKGKMMVKTLGHHLSPEDLIKTGTPLKQQLGETKAIIAARHRAPKKAVLLGTIAAILLMLPAGFYIPDLPLRNLGKVVLTPGEAKRTADSTFLEQTGLDPNTFLSTADHYAYMAGNDYDYFLSHLDGQSVSEKMRTTLYQNFWNIDYFRAEEQTTYTITLRPDGSLLLFAKNIGEKEAGAQLEKDPAVQTAAAFLEKELGIAPDQYRLASYSMKQLDHRRDHRIVFENTLWDIGKSRVRWPIYVQGDTVSDFNTRVILPEEYNRKRSSMGWAEAINGLIAQITSMTWFVGMILLLGLLLKGRHIRWRDSLLLGLIGPVLTLASQANQLPQFYAGYSTTQTMGNFMTTQLLGLLMELLMSYISLAAVFAVLSGLVRWLTGAGTLPALLGTNGEDARMRYWQGLGLALLGLFLTQGVQQLAAASQLLISEQGLLTWFTFQPDGLSTGLGILLDATSSSLFESLSSGIIILILILLSKKRPGLLILVIFLLLISKISLDWHGGMLAVHTALFQILATLVELWVLFRLFRFNGYSYLLFYFYQTLALSLEAMTRKGWPAYGSDIILLWAAAILPVLVALVCGIMTWRGAQTVQQPKI